MIAQLDSLYIRTSPQLALRRLISYAFFEGRPLTTKGQWINRFLLLGFEVQKRLPQLRTVRKPIFIVGTGRSGTTALGTILSMHKEVGFLNEPKALWHSIYPNEDLIGSYSRGFAKYRLCADDASERVCRVAHRLFGAYLGATASQRLVDKYPELIFRIPFVLKLFPDAKFIFLVRNGYATCNSIFKWSQRLGIDTKVERHNWWGADNRKWNLLWEQVIKSEPIFQNILSAQAYSISALDMAVIEWIAVMREGLESLNQYSDKIHMLRYEDLTTQPQHFLNQMLEFCELPADHKFMDYAIKTIRPTISIVPFPVQPLIQEPFRQTMSALGYEALLS
jgi:hypothetical protein